MSHLKLEHRPDDRHHRPHDHGPKVGLVALRVVEERCGHRVAVEAGSSLGWDRWIGSEGTFVGVDGFGASAPAPVLYAHYGITVDRIVAAAS